MKKDICPICKEVKADSIRKDVEVCQMCADIFDLMNVYEYKGMACQTFRLEAIIKNNDRLAEIMQNMHSVMFLNDELEIIKKRELEKGMINKTTNLTKNY